MVCGGRVDGVWREGEWCVEGGWMVCGGRVDGVWREGGWCVEGG